VFLCRPCGAVLESGPRAPAFPERSFSVSEKRIKVWVQKFPDRENLVLQWHDPETGKRKSQSAETADPDKAETARGDLESDLNHGRYAEASRMTWERFRELFEAEYLPGLRTDTQKVYGNVLNLFEKVCNPRALRSITERTISAFVAGLRKLPGRTPDRNSGGKMIPSTIQARLRFLRSALNWAAEQKLIREVPKFPRIELIETLPAAVPTEAFERLYAKAKGDSQTQAFLLCGWLAGLRRKEAMSLEWEETDSAPWVDLARDRIIFPAGFVKGKRDQWVPLDPELRRALEALPSRKGRVFFFDNGSGERMAPTTLSDLVGDLAKAANVKLNFKALRRGFGCRYAGKVPAQVLQKLMRHSNIAITMKYYANVDDAVEAAVLGDRRNTRRNSDQNCTSVAREVNDVSREARRESDV
jgi:integrase